MVTRGQFLERPTLIPVGKLVLEGLWHRGERRPPLLLISPLPGHGGMDHVLAAEVAWAAATAGHPTLRFNFRGVGASQGEQGTDRTCALDAEGALRLLEENTDCASSAVAAIGTGAVPALELLSRRPTIDRLCLLAPTGVSADSLLRVRTPLAVVVSGESLPDEAVHRAALKEAVFEARGEMMEIEGADPAFQRCLPQVGKAVVRWLTSNETR